MTGYTVHTGSTEKFSLGWDQIFGGKKPAKKAASASKAKAAKKAVGKATKSGKTKAAKKKR